MSQHPNIVLVMADQLTAFALSCYGNTVTKTPHLDRFADNAVVFENAYCNYPLCAPARFAMMSGRLPSNIAAYDNAAEFPASVPTIAHYLRDAGYYTSISGKMHFVGPDQHHGYEHRLTTEIYPADFSWTPPDTYDTYVDPEQSQLDGPAPGVSSVETITDVGPRARSMQMDYDNEVIHRACQHINDKVRYGDDRPLFLTVSFTQPHDPYVSRNEFWDLYTDEEIDLPRVPPIPLGEMDAHSRSLYFHYSLNKIDITEVIYRRARRGYYAMISDIDQKFGQLQRTLSECGMDENTLILFTSDHGDMLGERGLWFKKNLFDPAIRIPMMMSWPGRLAPARISQSASLVDVLPTFMDAAKIDDSALVTNIDGRSLLKKMDDKHTDIIVCAEHLDGGTKGPRVMLRKGNMKIVYSLDYPAQLFDLDEDPNELNNLALQSDWSETLNAMIDAVNAKWNLKELRNEIVQNQRVRQMLSRSLGKGDQRSWEHYPDPQQISGHWVRQGDFFPEVEQRGYIRYPNKS